VEITDNEIPINRLLKMVLTEFLQSLGIGVSQPFALSLNVAVPQCTVSYKWTGFTPRILAESFGSIRTFLGDLDRSLRTTSNACRHVRASNEAGSFDHIERVTEKSQVPT
jgi:hypothetical protein